MHTVLQSQKTKRMTIKTYQKWLGIIIVVIVTSLLYIDRLHYHAIWKVYGAHTVYTVLVWEANLWLLIRIRKRYPTIEQTRQRIKTQVIIFPITLAVMVSILSGFYDRTAFWAYDFNLKDYAYDYGVGLVFTFIVAGVYEGTYIIREWKSTTLESEQLKHEQLQTQLDSLKNQVNPHFLFNSLNSLSSLIETDDKKAIAFINELARVYRYLLQSNEQELTTLRNELNFIQAYFFLLKTRFEQGIHLNINISERLREMQIPPLTLQLLVENAVKHNIISSAKPLTIRIFEDSGMPSQQPKRSITEGGYFLIITNNLQKKNCRVESNRMGLQNIFTKYKLLGQPDVEINQNTEAFTVRIPLIQTNESILIPNATTE
jgi:phage-related protein